MDQRYKTYMTLPGLHAGMLTPEQLERLAKLVTDYGIPGIKITSAQRIALMGMEPERLSALQQDLNLDATLPHSRKRVHYVQACPGKTWCKYGVAETLGIAKKIEQLELDGLLPNKVKIGVSGCRMCCSESWLRDIGLIGERKGWRVIFGGNAAGRPRIGEELASGLGEDEAVELIRKALNFYIREAWGKTRTARMVERIGIDTVRQAVLGPQGQQPQNAAPATAQQGQQEDYMKSVRKIVEIDEELCDGCGLCVPDCAEGSLRIINGKARLVADKLCDGLGACLGACPTGALKIIEREADEFDEAAVEAFLKAEQAGAQNKPTEQQLGCGCPSSNLQSFQAMRDLRSTGSGSCQSANTPNTLRPSQSGSALSHWPVQIRLIPPTAPFLENADLLVAADCTALAYANLHQDFIQGRTVMMGCPKFDDQELYVERFTEIFRTRKLKSLTILIMEVPCCHSMLQIIKRALDAAKPSFPVKYAVVSLQGKIQQEQSL